VKFPREKTKVRAVFDLLSDGIPHTYSEASLTYSKAGDWRTVNRFSGMGITRILRKYATPCVPKGWKMKPEWLQAVEVAKAAATDQKVIARADHLLKPEQTEPTIQTGPRPAMSDICETCGEMYGSHYGPPWPGSIDCPVKNSRGFLERNEYPTAERPRTFWSFTDVVQIAEPEDVLVSEEMHLDAMADKDAVIEVLQKTVDNYQREVTRLLAENKSLANDQLNAVNKAMESRDQVIKNQLHLIQRQADVMEIQDKKLCDIDDILNGAIKWPRNSGSTLI
jgi:hypothetical protein